MPDVMTTEESGEKLAEPTAAPRDRSAEAEDKTIRPASSRSSNSSDTEEEQEQPQYDNADLAREHSNAESIWLATTLTLPREFLFVSVICLTQFCTQAAFCQTLYLIHQIGGDFGVTNPGQLSWLVAGYSLTVGTFILFSGRLGDAFGYKRMLLIGLGWFSLWSLIAGLSVYSDYVLFVFSRVFQGIGPAIALPNALAIFGASYPPGHRKAMVFSFFGACAPVGAMAGTAVGCALELLWWPWVLWSLSITLAIIAVVGYFVIPSPPRKVHLTWSLQTLVTELDLLGAVVGCTGLVVFNFAWNQAPLAGWDSAQVIVTLILGTLLLGAFFFIESRAKRPLLPFDAVNADVAFVLGAVACGWATFGVWTLYFLQILQQIRHLSPLLASAWFCPVAIAGVIAAVATGKLLGPLRTPPPVVMTLALLAFLIGVILATTAPVHQIYWAQTFVSVIIMPFGMDMSFPAATLILSDAVKKEHQGIAASLVNTVVNYGISLGVGFAGTVEVHVNNGGKTEEDMLKGFRGALYLGIGLAGLGLLICLAFLEKEYRKRRKQTAGTKEKNAESGVSETPATDLELSE